MFVYFVFAFFIFIIIFILFYFIFIFMKHFLIILGITFYKITLFLLILHQIFISGHLGSASYTAGKHFGDFLVWRSDGFPSYELAVKFVIFIFIHILILRLRFMSFN